ncbi:hypothetical protein FPV67DRAFT_1509869 [Lyophyllum atratum]|nr:hypothetical protein FPV67DRAFT_1509869 [Lyophyllum atratum]
MSSRDYFSFGDMYHILDETTALEPIDDVLGMGLPLISFQNLGSMLFAEDKGVPRRFHTAPEFLLRPGRQISHVLTDEATPISRSSRPPTRIDDTLVNHMKHPIDLPSSGVRYVPTDDTPSSEYSYGPDLPSQPTAHRRHHSSSSFISGRSSGLIPPHHSEPPTYSGASAREGYSEGSRRQAPPGHAKRPSFHYALPSPLPSVPLARFR